MPLRCYVISVPGSERRPRIAAALEAHDVPFEFVDGVVASPGLLDRATYDERHFRRRYGRSSAPTEVACALAHQRAYALIADRDDSAAVILEDDALPLDGFRAVVEAAVDTLEQGDIALLFHNGVVTPAGGRRVALPHGYELAYLHRREPLGTVGTIVTRKAAERLAEYGAPVRTTPDDWFLFSRRIVVRATVPSVVGHDESVPSVVGADRFAAPLDPPGVTEKVSWTFRTSRTWNSRPVRRLRERGLFWRIRLLRTSM